MFVLVKFSDETYYICKHSRLSLLSRSVNVKKKKTGIHCKIEGVVRHCKSVCCKKKSIKEFLDIMYLLLYIFT